MARGSVAGQSRRARLDALGAQLQAVLAARGEGAGGVSAIPIYSDDAPATVEANKARAGGAGLVVVIQKLCPRPQVPA